MAQPIRGRDVDLVAAEDALTRGLKALIERWGVPGARQVADRILDRLEREAPGHARN
jgi:hypothetical protein